MVFGRICGNRLPIEIGVVSAKFYNGDVFNVFVERFDIFFYLPAENEPLQRISVCGKIL